MKQNIAEFFQSKSIAVLGASRTGKKFGNAVNTELKQRGYQTYLIHPEAKEIDGQICYPSITSVKDQIDAIIINVKPDQAVAALREAVSLDVKRIWVQQGAESTALHTAAKELNVNPVTGKCVFMYAEPVGTLHGIHKFFAKITGQY